MPGSPATRISTRSSRLYTARCTELSVKQYRMVVSPVSSIFKRRYEYSSAVRFAHQTNPRMTAIRLSVSLENGIATETGSHELEAPASRS